MASECILLLARSMALAVPASVTDVYCINLNEDEPKLVYLLRIDGLIP